MRNNKYILNKNIVGMRIIKKNNILKLINNYLYDSLLPININYLYNTGSILGVMMILQIVTGIILAMFYISNIKLAFYSIDNIIREIQYGWLIRYLHMNGATILFFILYIHISRGIIYGSYIKRNTWIIGIIIFLLMIITAFLGYSLPWGQMSFWAVTVITNLCTSIPVIGKELVKYIWGDFTVGNATLNRFFSLHYLLPFIIIGLIIGHLIELHSKGGTNPLGVSNQSLINFNPYYTYKDILGFLIIGLILIVLIGIEPELFNHSDNYIEANSLETPTHIVPEIYFLPFYAILRAIPNKILGIIAMILSIVILIFLNTINNHIIKTSYFRPIYYYITIIFFINLILLTWIGQEVVEEPYITISQILTSIYFIYFILIYITSYIEYFLYNISL
uniref:Cytochrome b n=1 Tax=Mitosporidium daphniae TaxID=1485682 RepID=A0A8F1SZJ4_9MICR|nr:apocytochrome b [Mitosporidium daphniae]